MHICSLRRGQLEPKSSRLPCATLQNPIKKKKKEIRESKPGRKKERKQALMMAQRVKALAAKSDNPGTYMLTEEDVLLHATYRHHMHAHRDTHTQTCTYTHAHTDTSICMHTETHQEIHHRINKIKKNS